MIRAYDIELEHKGRASLLHIVSFFKLALVHSRQALKVLRPRHFLMGEPRLAPFQYFSSILRLYLLAVDTQYLYTTIAGRILKEITDIYTWTKKVNCRIDLLITRSIPQHSSLTVLPLATSARSCPECRVAISAPTFPTVHPTLKRKA